MVVDTIRIGTLVRTWLPTISEAFTSPPCPVKDSTDLCLNEKIKANGNIKQADKGDDCPARRCGLRCGAAAVLQVRSRPFDEEVLRGRGV